MAIIQPIKALRPVRDKVAMVASRAVNTYSPRLLDAKLEQNPYAFLNVILPEHGKNAKTAPNSIDRFKLIKKKFDEFCKEGILIEEKKACIYIYRQITKGMSFTGLIAGHSIGDYKKGIIKVHEQTLKQRQEMFTDYLETCEFNAEPVLLTYEENKKVESIIAKYVKQRAEYEFTKADRITHFLWVIDKQQDIKAIQRAFASIDSIYIADGHHRCASSAGLLDRKLAKGDKVRANDKLNFCLSFFLPHAQLQILEYNRLVNEAESISNAQILKAIEKNYSIVVQDSKIAKPKVPGQVGMFMQGKWYLLTIKKELKRGKNAAEKLDASLLTKYILDPLFDIKDLTHDNRIAFAGGNRGPEYLQEKVNSGEAALAFYLHPVSFKELKDVSDEKLIMPPKSTYILPKLRSGLIIQSLK